MDSIVILSVTEVRPNPHMPHQVAMRIQLSALRTHALSVAKVSRYFERLCPHSHETWLCVDVPLDKACPVPGLVRLRRVPLTRPLVSAHGLIDENYVFDSSVAEPD